MLFSATLEVKAATVYQSVDISFRIGVPTESSTSGSIYNGSGSILAGYTSTGSQMHFYVPINYFQNTSNWSFNDSGIALLNSYINYYGLFYFPTITVSHADYYVSNVVLCDKNHVPVTSHDGYFEQKTVKGSEIFDASLLHVNMFYYLEFDLGVYHSGYQADPSIFISGGGIEMDFRSATESEISAAAVEVTSNQLDSIADSSAAIEESVTSDTGGGLLATIKSWFGSFFSNLIGVFVPEDGFFTDWFSRVNSLLSAKLGMLYAPFDLIISILTAVYGSSGTFTGIPIPEIAWEGTVLIPAQTLTFQNLLGNHFSTLQGYVYFGTDVVLLWAFLVLLQRKITLIFRGSESG